MSTAEEMAETVEKAMKLVPTVSVAEVLETEPDVVAVEMDSGAMFFLKVIEA